MFTNIVVMWLMIAFMIGMIIMSCIKIFSHIHTFRFLKQKATAGGLLFISAIIIVPLTESIFMSLRISHQKETGNFFFALIAFASFVCAIWTIFPSI